MKIKKNKRTYNFIKKMYYISRYMPTSNSVLKNKHIKNTIGTGSFLIINRSPYLLKIVNYLIKMIDISNSLYNIDNKSM